MGPVDEADGSDEDDIDDLQKTDLEKLETTYDDLKQPNDGSNEGCGPAEVHVHPIENLQIEDTNDVRGNEVNPLTPH